MTVAAFMPVRFFAETPTFSVSPFEPSPLRDDSAAQESKTPRPQDKDPTATVDKLRWESRAPHRNLRRHAHGEWFLFFGSPGSHEGV